MKITKKIKLLKQLRKKFITKEYQYGLCNFLNEVVYIPKKDLDLFTLKNAILHANANPDSIERYFWWGNDVNYLHHKSVNRLHINDSPIYDFDNRLLFIDWMISEYTKQLNFFQKLIIKIL